MFCRVAGALACATIFLLCSVSARADQQQLQALLAKYFISNHQAIPLHNNGKVKSGDVLKMPEEATYLSRDMCYSLPPVSYTSLSVELIRTTTELAGELDGQIPTRKIADIEAELHGKLRETATLAIDPLSEEEPSSGYDTLWKTNGKPECGVIANILRGKAQDEVLVTRVFHGSINAVSTFNISGGSKFDAAIEQEKINSILGGKPHVRLKADGSIIQLELSKSPEPQSLAFQSAAVNFDQLARIYLAYHTRQDGIELEWLVYEYITGTEPGLLSRLRIAISSWLEKGGVRQATAAAFYRSVLTGEKLLPAYKVPQAQWKALATVAAAHEIVGAQ